MFKRKENGQIMLLLLVIVFIASFLLVGGVLPKKGKISVPNEKLVATEKKAQSSEESLQLDKIAFMTVSPSPSPAPTSPPPPPGGGPPPPPPPPPPDGTCVEDKPTPATDCECTKNLIDCSQGLCVNVISSPDGYTCETPYYDSGENLPDGRTLVDSWCGEQGFENGQFCVGKPVIYLYPKEKMLVDVKVETPGYIFISDPAYPIGGWKKVLAYPDGNLYYQGKNYKELYYETSVSKVNPPKNGLIIPKEKIEAELKTATTKLGLNDFEQKEFLEYWLPRLKNLNSPYILFSILEKEEKERIDKVIISPEPDTRIEFIAYFKPLTASKVEGLTPLILPNEPPKRIGFTAVEWGGTIDY